MIKSLKTICKYLYSFLQAFIILKVIEKAANEIIRVVKKEIRASTLGVLATTLVTRRILGILLGLTKKNKLKLKKFALSKRKKLVKLFD